MPRSSKYFFTVLFMYLVMNVLSMTGLIKPSLDLLAMAWLASMALPLILPVMARQLDMKPVLWNLIADGARALLRALDSIGSRRL